MVLPALADIKRQNPGQCVTDVCFRTRQMLGMCDMRVRHAPCWFFGLLVFLAKIICVGRQ